MSDEPLKFDQHDQTNTAICADDGCAWKYRGTLTATYDAAEMHVDESRHAVTVYEERRTTISHVAEHTTTEGEAP